MQKYNYFLNLRAKLMNKVLPGLMVAKLEFQYELSFLLNKFSMPNPGSRMNWSNVIECRVVRFHCDVWGAYPYVLLKRLL